MHAINDSLPEDIAFFDFAATADGFEGIVLPSFSPELSLWTADLLPVDLRWLEFSFADFPLECLDPRSAFASTEFSFAAGSSAGEFSAVSVVPIAK